MKIPRYWVRLEHELLIEGQAQPSTFIGYSSVSVEDAQRKARERIAIVEARIAGTMHPEDSDYEIPIREEIVKELSEDAVVTRNRYGAEVLNCARLVMIDVDRAPEQGLWAFLFKRDRRTPKERMLAHIRQVAIASRNGLGYRIYETHNGFRVIVTGKAMAPTDPEVDRLFQAMNCDQLYALLCRRQDCYRARLTPKPSRIRQKAIRLKFPYTPELSMELKEWLPAYTDRSRRYAVCKLVEVIGRDDADEVIRYHDDRTACRSGDALA